MPRIAIYPSVLYGEDFIAESIISIVDYVDRVYVCMMKRPWGGTKGVTYKGEWVEWPEKFDRTRERLANLTLWKDRIEIIEAEKFSPWNRWGYAVNNLVKPAPGTEVVLIDPDCVFEDEQAKQVFGDWEAHPEYQWAAPNQIELWRTPLWHVTRPRTMTSFHRGDLSLLTSADPPDGKPRAVPLTKVLKGRVHNFGFCCSPANTKWKHLTSMAFSPIVGETGPNPDWYDKWLNWKPGVRDLEPSLRCESAIPYAVPYEGNLPVLIKLRVDVGEWPVYEPLKEAM